jgi:glutamate-ammonia-ligase adenylyltransferase
MMREGTRTRILRAGFSDSRRAGELLDELAGLLQLDDETTLSLFETFDPEPEVALRELVELLQREPDLAKTWGSELDKLRSVISLFATSTRLVELVRRHPDVVDEIYTGSPELPTSAGMDRRLRAAVEDLEGDDAVEALRIRYRVELARITLYDMRLPQPEVSIHRIGEALADLASSTIDVALDLARREISAPAASFGKYPADEVANVRLAVIGMGKCGARELNYISDIDVMFVAEPAEGSGLEVPRAIEIATRLASRMMHIVMDYAVEPPLWEVDANLRPEGKDGALVRTLDSYLQYYERWAENWEFMALLKSRAIAGDLELGTRFTDAVAPLVWNAGDRDDFVLGVQRMRKRVIDHIPREEVDRELKLGPGGLRDIEFPVQLLQIVHGQVDEHLRVRSTLDAITALTAEGHIGRDDAAQFSNDYRFLRLLEHRVQLRRLQRTHLVPDDQAALRALARGARSESVGQLRSTLAEVRRRVRQLHEKLFFRPLVAAASRLSADEFQLADERVLVRLRAIGYQDARGALAHIQALTQGVSRRATMQRNLLPVLLEWLAEGTDPDQGLLAFRKLSEQNGEASWYLRLLRDSNLAARRLCAVLANSSFCATFLELFPEAVKWLDSDSALRPRTEQELWPEFEGALKRHDDEVRLGRILRGLRRREMLRIALTAVLGGDELDAIAQGLTTVAELTIRGAIMAVRRIDERAYPPFAVIALGRFGGRELGIGSDLDVVYVYGTDGYEGDDAAGAARTFVRRIQEVLDDARLPIDLDADLRPEGKNGELVRSLTAYDNYYAKWSLGWEAQALLRARGIAGDQDLIDGFIEIADRTRYRSSGLAAKELMEIRRIKARVEDERLPHGVDPRRHLKLGRGSLSDVEWLVQSIQLDRGHDIPELRTTSTLDALEVARQHGIVSYQDVETLRAAWVLASRVRSGVLLYSNAQTDVLPGDPFALEGVARILGYEPGSGVELENDYLNATRRARAVFERVFYGDE